MIFLVVSLFACAGALTAPSRRTTSAVKMAVEAAPTKVTYGENSRPYRRTFFKGPADWENHRSTDRIKDNLLTSFQSGVYRALVNEVAIISGVALAVATWNAVGNGDIGGLDASMRAMFPQMMLPGAVFSLTAPALSLLLVFRTNASYARWDDSRKIWGTIINTSRILTRQVVSWQEDDAGVPLKVLKSRRANVDRVGGLMVAFARCKHLQFHRTSTQMWEDNDAFAQELIKTNTLGISEKDAKFIADAPKNRIVASLVVLSQAINEASKDFDDQVLKLVEMDKAVGRLDDCLGASERMYNTPVPLIYTRHASRFLAAYLLVMPLALVTNDGFAPGVTHFLHSLTIVPESALIATFLFGIDRLSITLEEPFTILALDAYATGIDGVVTQVCRSLPPLPMTTSEKESEEKQQQPEAEEEERKLKFFRRTYAVNR